MILKKKNNICMRFKEEKRKTKIKNIDNSKKIKNKKIKFEDPRFIAQIRPKPNHHWGFWFYTSAQPFCTTTKPKLTYLQLLVLELFAMLYELVLDLLLKNR